MLIDLLMAFSELEKRKHEKFLEKQYAGARANIEQKPYGTSLTVPLTVLLHRPITSMTCTLSY